MGGAVVCERGAQAPLKVLRVGGQGAGLGCRKSGCRECARSPISESKSSLGQKGGYSVHAARSSVPRSFKVTVITRTSGFKENS